MNDVSPEAGISSRRWQSISGWIVITCTILGVVFQTAEYFTSRSPSIKIQSTGTVTFKEAQLLSSKFELLVNSEKVADPTFVMFEIVNTGRAPIRSGDFEQNLTLETSDKFEIAGVFNIKSLSTVQPVWLRHSLTKFAMEPVMLNPGDKITAFACFRTKDFPSNYTMGTRGDIRWSARVPGMKSLEYVDDPYQNRNLIRLRFVENAVVTFSEYQVFGFLGGILIVFAISMIVYFSGIRGRTYGPLGKTIAAIILLTASASTAEIVLHYFWAEGTTSPLCYPLLVAHFLLLFFFITPPRTMQTVILPLYKRLRKWARPSLPDA